MNEALRRMAQHRVESLQIDRRGWTDEQWVEDARRLMDDLDGSISSLVNGHVLALLRSLDTQPEHMARRERETAAQAQTEALTHARACVAQYVATAEKWRYDRVVWAFGIMLGEIPEDAPEPMSPADHRILAERAALADRIERADS